MAWHLYFTFFAEIITVIFGIGSWHKLPLPYKLIVVQVFLAFSVEATGLYIVKVYHANNLWLYNAYLLLEIWLILSAGIFFTASKTARQVGGILIAVLTFFWLYKIIASGYQKFLPQVMMLYYIATLLLFLHVAYNNAVFSSKKVLQQPLFLICISLITSFAVTIPLFGIMNYLNETDIELSGNLFHIIHIASIFRYWLVALAIYLYIRQAKREIAV